MSACDREFDVAIASAVDSVSNQQITFVSMHVVGSELTPTECKTPEQGNAYCEAVSKLVKDDTNVIIGADMNASPWNCAVRFSYFEEDGYHWSSSTTPTAWLVTDPYSARLLDFIMVKGMTQYPAYNDHQGLWVARIPDDKDVTFHEIRPLYNASDHTMIFSVVAPLTVTASAATSVSASTDTSITLEKSATRGSCVIN